MGPAQFTFIDLFAGIGGMRLGFEAAGGKCVFSSEWNTYAASTYETNFGERPNGDLTQISSDLIPEHDILLAGFPCQPFSIAGVSKNRSLGRSDGFLHKTQGTLFFDVARILRDRQPSAFLLENVRNLQSHDKGRTLAIILEVLEHLGYEVRSKIIDGSVAVPQHRERIYIVGFLKPVEFTFPTFEPRQTRLCEILEEFPSERYILTANLWRYLQSYAEKHRARGNGFGFGLVDLTKEWAVTRTLSARYHKDGSEILIPTKAGTPRRLTPRECARLMGFPESFAIPVSDTQAYRQFGNSVVVPVVEAIAREIVKCLTATPAERPLLQTFKQLDLQYQDGGKRITSGIPGATRVLAGSP